jgi:hypothetical protein
MTKRQRGPSVILEEETGPEAETCLLKAFEMLFEGVVIDLPLQCPHLTKSEAELP